MLIIDGTILSNYADEHSKESQSLLPELVTTTIMNEHNEDDLLLTVFGSILGRSQIGDDGIFPHEFVRSFIEQSNNKNLIREIFIGKLNSRGARIVLDGTEEKTISAKRIEISYPETAILLRRLGDEYSSNSKRDRLYAEIGGF